MIPLKAEKPSPPWWKRKAEIARAIGEFARNRGNGAHAVDKRSARPVWQSFHHLTPSPAVRRACQAGGCTHGSRTAEDQAHDDAPRSVLDAAHRSDAMKKRIRCVTRHCTGAVELDSSAVPKGDEGLWQFQCPSCKYWNLTSREGAVHATSHMPFDLDKLPASLRLPHVRRSPPGGV
jgi:hypothetical protein